MRIDKPAIVAGGFFALVVAAILIAYRADKPERTVEEKTAEASKSVPQVDVVALRGNARLYRYTDPSNGTTCYLIRTDAISCIPKEKP